MFSEVPNGAFYILKFFQNIDYAKKNHEIIILNFQGYFHISITKKMMFLFIYCTNIWETLCKHKLDSSKQTQLKENLLNWINCFFVSNGERSKMMTYTDALIEENILDFFVFYVFCELRFPWKYRWRCKKDKYSLGP